MSVGGSVLEKTYKTNVTLKSKMMSVHGAPAHLWKPHLSMPVQQAINAIGEFNFFSRINASHG